MRLVEIRPKDFDFLLSLTTNEKIYKYIRNGKKWTKEKVDRFIGRCMDSQKLDPESRKYFYYIILSDEGEEVGVIGVSQKGKNYSLTIFLDPQSQGKGFFSRSLTLMIRRMKRYRKRLRHIYAQVHVKNKKMNSIMAKKYHFTRHYNIGSITVNEYQIYL